MRARAKGAAGADAEKKVRVYCCERIIRSRSQSVLRDDALAVRARDGALDRRDAAGLRLGLDQQLCVCVCVCGGGGGGDDNGVGERVVVVIIVLVLVKG